MKLTLRNSSLALGLSALALSAASATQAQTLVDRYSFNDTGNTVVDTVGSQNGVLGNATEANGAVNTGAGAVVLPNNYMLPTGAVSFEDFFTPTAGANTGFNTLFSFSASGTNYLVAVAGRGGDGKPSVDLEVGGNQIVAQAATQFTPGAVNQFVATYDGTNESVYLNGLLSFQIADTKFPSDIGTATTLNGIGGNSPFNDPSLAGTTTELRIYSGALNASQVAANYKAGPDVLPNAPVPEASTTISLGLLLTLGGLAVAVKRRKANAAA